MEHGTFPYDGLNVVITSKKIKSKWENVIFTNKPPKEALSLFKKANKKTIMVGGGRINSSFMKANLVDELYLTIAPTIFTKGIKLFDGDDFEAKLELLGVKAISKNEIQLHYKVLKHR